MDGGWVLLYAGHSDDAASGLAAYDGWAVQRAETVTGATSRLDAVDCLVTEQSFSDGTGLDLCRTVRDRCSDTPVVLVPESGSDELARRAVSVGVDQYVPTSTLADHSELRTVVDRVLSDTESKQSRYRTLVEQTMDVLSVVDTDGTVQEVTTGSDTVLGHEPAELVGVDVFEFIHPGDRDAADDALQAALSNPDEATTLTCRVKHASESYRWVKARIRSFADDPSVGGVVVSGRDVTEHRDRERELATYETMLDAVPDMMYALDEDGYFTAINDRGVEMLGREQDELLGSHVSIAMDGPDIQAGERHIRELLRDDDRHKAIYEMDLYPADGTPIPGENHIAILTDSDGVLRGSVGVLRDISDRRRREHRLTVLNRALRHDLRNSMHVILANAELVERSVSDRNLQERLETIQHRAEEINGLSEKAREIEQTLAERSDARTRIDLPELITDQIALFREQYPDATIEADLPTHARVQATDLIDVAVENLIDNSVRHNDEPTVSVDITVHDELVTVTVADDGPGIPETERRVVTQGTETPLDHASGLGLWLVAWITRDSEGDIVFEDRPSGSAVRLELERAEPPSGQHDRSGGRSGDAEESVD